MKITTIGLDLAKSVFQAHGMDETGETVLVKKLHRKQMLPFFSKLAPCLIGVEACATAHHWARTLIAMGHDVRIDGCRKTMLISGRTRTSSSRVCLPDRRSRNRFIALP